MTATLTPLSLPAIAQPKPSRPSPVANLLDSGQRNADTQRAVAAVDLLATGHSALDTQKVPAGSDTPPPTHPSDQTPPIADPGAWVELRICADLFWRAQEERKAVANLLRHTDPDYFGEHLARLEVTEHAALLMMRRCYRRVALPELRAWQKASRGVGEDSFARILGHLGDPYIATPHRWEGTGAARVLLVGEPYVRTVSQLWSYCGHGDPLRRPKKGMTADEAAALGNPGLKMLVHLQAEWCMKSGGVYRDVYDAVRLAAADKVHAVPCVRCGPSGKPAAEGSPWSKGHQHAHALRLTGKAILRDMWLTRHNAHQLATGQTSADTQAHPAGSDLLDSGHDTHAAHAAAAAVDSPQGQEATQ